MKIIDLAGKWYLKEKNHNEIIEGKLPGCNFLDLMKNNKIKDVFVGKNELEASWVGERDWEYYRDYDISQSLLQNEFVFLKISKPDTICDIFINDKLVAKAKNSHLDYEFDIKEYLKVGKNSIRILFYSPIKYIEKKQNQDKFPYNHMGINGFAHIRKAAYHFGWDWGPVLPPSGVNGDIKIVAFQKAYIKDVDISQRHFDNKVNLEIKSFIVSRLKDVELVLCVKIYDPQEGLIYEKKGDKYAYNFVVENPKLWQPNGYIKRDVEPLYKIDVSLSDNKGIVQDNKSYKIGLRTIELDTSKDSFGYQFAFIVNKRRIFAKGGNWIPSDSFITRVSDDKLEKLIKSCKSANMNMIRVWGGGFYESDFFYELCDKYGILVWQDFMFACHPYPFYEGDFLQSVKDEIAFNVKRLKHHPCLGLWCGNNEIQMMNMAWFYKRKFIKAERMFFYDFLPDFLKKFDKDTPYWYSSPSSGNERKNTNSDKYGDTHLWHVWHGLKPFEYYKKRFSRFCSEFGFESMPDIDTVRTFAQEKDFDLFSDVMLSHQKCMSGNAKIIYYMCDNYCIPKDFFELIYVSQLTQAVSIKSAVEHWRRNAGRCNGALYWQLNDCWPTLSWSGMDYYGRWKALQYFAKRFFEPLTVSVDQNKKSFFINLINDSFQDFEGHCKWQLMDFDNRVYFEGENKVILGGGKKIVIDVDKEKKTIKDHKNSLVFNATLLDKEKRKVSTNNLFFNRINKLNLSKANIEYNIIRKKDEYAIELSSNTFCKNVFLHLKDNTEAFSDNFFDLLKAQTKTVTVKSEKGLKEVEKDLRIICYNNITAKYSKLKHKIIKYKIALKPFNLLARVLYEFM